MNTFSSFRNAFNNIRRRRVAPDILPIATFSTSSLTQVAPAETLPEGTPITSIQARPAENEAFPMSESREYKSFIRILKDVLHDYSSIVMSDFNEVYGVDIPNINRFASIVNFDRGRDRLYLAFINSPMYGGYRDVDELRDRIYRFVSQYTGDI